MNIDTRKLRLIEAFSSLDDITKIEKIESILLSDTGRTNRKNQIESLSGSWSEEEADDIRKVIADGCEKIDKNEW